MSGPKPKAKSKADASGPVPLTPSEVKAKARQFFYKLLGEGKSPWPTKFLSAQGFQRGQCGHCRKYFWSYAGGRTNCGDSTCAGGYSFLHPETPPATRLTYHQAWKDFVASFTTGRVRHDVVPRYPVVARWRSDVDFVAAGIYCFQPFCVSGRASRRGTR
jgi:alanyl-tRNA synthetase